MAITYYKIKLECGVICTFRCTTPRQKLYILSQLMNSNYQLIDSVTVER